MTTHDTPGIPVYSGTLGGILIQLQSQKEKVASVRREQTRINGEILAECAKPRIDWNPDLLDKLTVELWELIHQTDEITLRAKELHREAVLLRGRGHRE